MTTKNPLALGILEAAILLFVTEAVCVDPVSRAVLALTDLAGAAG
jgi:hypothetical protein